MSKTEAPKATKFLSFDDFLRADPHEYRNIPAPEMGGILRVRGFTGAERDAWEASRMREKAPSKNGDGDESGSGYTQDFSSYRVMAVALAAVHEDNSPMFSMLDAHGAPAVSPKNLEVVGRMPASLVQRAFNAIIELSALSPAARKALEGN